MRWTAIPRTKLVCQIDNANGDLLRTLLSEKKKCLLVLEDDLDFHHQSKALAIYLTRKYLLNTTHQIAWMPL